MRDVAGPALRSVHDRAELAGLLGADPELYAYQLGDLDDFFWPYTTWYRHGDQVALVYHGAGEPTLLALDRRPERLAGLLGRLAPLLPRRVYAHLSTGAELALAEAFDAGPGHPHLRMALTDPGRLDLTDPAGRQLGQADLPELLALYREAYPENWFDPRMLQTGYYHGIHRDGRLVAVAGVHVWSPAHRIGALGNITTLPRYRGRGLAGAVVSGLCRRMLASADHIALNVRADNAAAIAVYGRLGFTEVARFNEWWLTARPGPATC